MRLILIFAAAATGLFCLGTQVEERIVIAPLIPKGRKAEAHSYGCSYFHHIASAFARPCRPSVKCAHRGTARDQRGRGESFSLGVVRNDCIEGSHVPAHGSRSLRFRIDQLRTEQSHGQRSF